ncbi:serine hydrolase [Nocardia sp. NPDC050697]|uniref:serine hydrolase n=1 Tax=Nocardia sp. NPDC050697 TaxID=3155158 RepID=UPI0033C5C01A
MSADRSGRVRAVIGCAVFAAAALLTSCATGTNISGTDETTITEAAARTEQHDLSYALPGTLAADFAELQASTGGAIGLAAMPVGGTSALSFGTWSTGPAWSTMKVPLVLAAQRKAPGTNTYAATAAITESDNTAADALWQSLGSGPEAAAAVEAVLREGGDTTTRVPATRPRAEHSAFGQAEWSLADQVKFAAKLPCLSGAAGVTALMAEIVPAHRWGMGSIAGADFKGGWGPDPDGDYLVRQFGLVDGASGQIAVAFAAKPDSGAFSDGMLTLNRMATVLAAHLKELPSGKCRR